MLLNIMFAAASTDMAGKINQYIPVIFFVVAFFCGAVIFLQWRWGKVASENVQLLVVKSDGHGDYELAPQRGGSVTIKNPHSDTVQTWPINKLATIDVPYPGVGFVPKALQKTIRQVIVDEEDWEPLLNRSPYKEKIASPDVIRLIQDVAESVQDAKPELAITLAGLADELSPAPTREMIASPAVLGNLINEKITEAVITVNKDTIDSVTRLLSRVNNLLQNNTFYIGVGIVGLLCIINLILMVTIKSDIGAVSKAIGIVK